MSVDNRKRVVLLMGGTSSEHDVSMASGRLVAKHLDPAKYEVLPVTISREGRWHFGDGAPATIYEAIGRLGSLRPDCVFLALHGPFGEDGRIQGMLDLIGLPYVGSGCCASALAMDKVRSKAVVRDLGVRVAREVIVAARDWVRDPEGVRSLVCAELGFPCVVKDPCEGSSLGMSMPQTPADFAEAAALALRHSGVFMVEEMLRGTEVTCGVLDVDAKAPPRALPVTEIVPKTSAYFDYEAKYTAGATEEITPARVSEDIIRRVQDIALAVHQAIGCRTWSRSDLIVVDGDPVWIEVNTIPGMTDTSLYPQAAAAVGIDYATLLDMFVESAIQPVQDGE